MCSGGCHAVIAVRRHALNGRVGDAWFPLNHKGRVYLEVLTCLMAQEEPSVGQYSINLICIALIEHPLGGLGLQTLSDIYM